MQHWPRQRSPATTPRQKHCARIPDWQSLPDGFQNARQTFCQKSPGSGAAAD